MAKKVFISHSSRDRDIAKALVNLIRSSLLVSPKEILCTSVDGYRLPAGVNVNEKLRTEVLDAKVLIGVISGASLESAYVIFELGARWGAGKCIVPLLLPDVQPSVLEGPLGDFNTVNCNRGGLLQLIDDLGRDLGIPPEKNAVYAEEIENIVKIALASRPINSRIYDNIDLSCQLQDLPKTPGTAPAGALYAEIAGPATVFVGKRAIYRAEFDGNLDFEWHYTQPVKLTDRSIFVELGYVGQTETLTLKVFAPDGRTFTTSKMITAV